MYKAFKLKASKEEINVFPGEAAQYYQPITATVSNSDMDNALRSDNANWIMDNWFKAYSADVFISHAHGDKGFAEKIAGIFSFMGLRVFIDSDVWGYSANLLKKIDNAHCVSKRANDGTIETYDYKRRNITTSQVSILLAHALMRMISHTECFVFLETGKSSIQSTSCDISTYSPWIFHELETVNIVEEQKLTRRRYLTESVAMDKSATEGVQPYPVLRFNAQINKFRSVSLRSLVERAKYVKERNNMSKLSERERAMYFLDDLYQFWD